MDRSRSPASESDKFFDNHFKYVYIFLLVSLLALTYALSKLPEYAPPPPDYKLSDRHCITGILKFGLVLTHIIAFVLIPVAMKVFYDAQYALRFPKSSIFATQLGLAFIMVAIASEIGWHVTQCWYYANQYTMLNFGFYFFLLSAFALWSDGLVSSSTKLDHWINVIYAVMLIIVSVLYPIGASNGDSKYKVPIYIALKLIFAVLTVRAYFVLDWLVILFPLFSVGVNLFFVWWRSL